MAPAGSMEALVAAVDSGADSVYFGLGELNARRGAENINSENLRDAVEYAHSRKAKAYLTLNIDIAPRELGLAARYIEFAAGNSIDAIIMKDTAIFLLIPCYPEIRFHLSTQAAISTSAGVRAAREFGISRVILPRELDFEEIKAASSVSGIETEIFVQGAMCFSVSGRCLLSSWIGGRSGNRGLCASPCRFKWETGSGEGNFLSAFDISLAERIGKIRESGVSALKIEGRLKSPEWVAKAVKMYRKVLDCATDGADLAYLRELKAYAGREMTSSIFDGKRRNITGESGRPKSRNGDEDRTEDLEKPKALLFDISIAKDDKSLQCSFVCGTAKKDFMIAIPSLEVNTKKVSSPEILDYFNQLQINDICPGKISVSPENMEIRKKDLKTISNEILSFVRKAGKKTEKYLKIDIRENARRILDGIKTNRQVGKLRHLGEKPDRARVSGFPAFCEIRKSYPGLQIVAGNLRSEEINGISDAEGRGIIISLPAVIYESGLDETREIIRTCKGKGLVLEVNSWDGWFLANGKNAKFEAGPGLMILNPLAAEFLRLKNFCSATVSMEADKEKIAEVCQASPLPLSIVVYGRPVLMFTRIEPDPALLEQGTFITDKKGMTFCFAKEKFCYSLRPKEPFDLSREKCTEIGVEHIVADLAGEKEPAKTLFLMGKLNTVKFNFAGKLK